MTQPVSRSRAAERAAPPTVLALDLGGTHLRTAVVLPDGTLLARRKVATPTADAEHVLQACLAQLGASRREAEEAGARPAAITISAPGPLDPARGVLIDPPNLHRSLWGFPLGPRLEEVLKLPALLERDTQVAALGEGLFGEGVGLSDFVYLTVSTGVGGAVVSEGRLLRGPDGVAGELGHLTVEMNGPPCGCGARGHLETLSSGTGIAAAARRAFEAGDVKPASPLGALIAERGVAALGGRDVASAEELGDELAAAIMERARRALAVALVSIVDVFNPQRVIVGGGVAAGQGERLLAPARERVRSESFRTQARRVEIVSAGLGDDVSLLGGLGLAQLPPLQQGETGLGRMTLTSHTGMGEHVTHEQEHTGAASLR